MNTEKNMVNEKPARPLAIWVAIGLMFASGVYLAYSFFGGMCLPSILNPICPRDTVTAVACIPVFLVLLYIWFKTLVSLWNGGLGARLILFVFAFLAFIPVIFLLYIGERITFNSMRPLIGMAFILASFYIPSSSKWLKGMQRIRESKGVEDAMSEIRRRYCDFDSLSPNEQMQRMHDYFNEQDAELKKETKSPFWLTFLSATVFALLCAVVRALIRA